MFQDVRAYNTPFYKVQNHLKLFAIDGIGTPAEPIVSNVGRYKESPDDVDRKHAIDMYSGELDNFHDCHTVQIKTIQSVNTPQGFIGLKFEDNEFSQVPSVDRYCEYNNVYHGIKACTLYPKSYVFIQWQKQRAHLTPKWFVVVDTIDLYVGLSDVVNAILNNSEALINLSHRGVFPRDGGRPGQWWFESGRLHFTIELFDLLGVNYYLSPASMRLERDSQCHLF